jgi:hypothetical protein
MTTMTYIPAWERNYDKWDTEPDFYDIAQEEELENAKVEDELSIEDIAEEELSLDEEFDL